MNYKFYIGDSLKFDEKYNKSFNEWYVTSFKFFIKSTDKNYIMGNGFSGKCQIYNDNKENIKIYEL